MSPTSLSHLIPGLIADAQIRIYPDSAHGFLFQYPLERWQLKSPRSSIPRQRNND
jgi:hypothetical protein